MALLDNQTAFVTGGGQGIGRGIAMELAGAGANVVITHLPNPADAENARRVCADCADIEGKDRRALAVAMDVTDEASVKHAVSEALKHLGCIDILVNNAGVMQGGGGAETAALEFDRCYAVNLRGLWVTTQEILPHFKRQGAGKIVNICSTAGREGQPETPAYCASKAGVISVTQSLATSLGPLGINVNAVCPGFVWTPMSEKYADLVSGAKTDAGPFLERMRDLLPIRRLVTAEDVGHAVVFLASPLAKSITGQALNVDGGYMLN